MEDAATAEISRVQVHQWMRHNVLTAEGQRVDKALVSSLLHEEGEKMAAHAKGKTTHLLTSPPTHPPTYLPTGEEEKRALALARVLVGGMMVGEGAEHLPDFLTSVCYPYVQTTTGGNARL